MVARMLSLGVVLGLSALASLGLSPLSAAEGAYPVWSAHAAPTRRPMFRPWRPAASQSFAAGSRAKPHSTSMRAVTTQISPRRLQASPTNRWPRQPAFSAARAGGRKAVPVTRGQDLGLRFRPDERGSPYGQSDVPVADEWQGQNQSELQSQFRPTQGRRKPTYEELQAREALPQQMTGPAMPNPMMPPPLPGYGGDPYWRGR